MAALAGAAAPAATADTRIAAENAHRGTTAWRVDREALRGEIEGYASKTSVDRGGRIRIFVNTQDRRYRLSVFRMGWYGGRGGRRVMGPVRRRGVSQPAPERDPATGRIECHWKRPFVLRVPRRWVSGVYLVKLSAPRSHRQRHVIFVVRDDDRRSALLYQASVNTWQAYNDWGGKSLYDLNSPSGRAYAVSFDRPYAYVDWPGLDLGSGQFLHFEYPMVRWLERRGYDVSYSTDVDTSRHGRRLLRHRGLLVVGHDEYWTSAHRDNVEAARAAGVSLGVFSSNTGYWQVRYDGRTMVAYKDVAARMDPYALDGDAANDRLLTGRFRDPPVARPESTLLGTMYEPGGYPVAGDLRFAEAVDSPTLRWLVRGTGLRPGSVVGGLLGYEADRAVAPAPDGCLFEVARSPYTTDAGFSSVASATAWAERGVPSAWVFSSGTMWWSWGLDAWSTRHIYGYGSRVSPAIRRLTANLLRRFRKPPPAAAAC